MYIICLQKHFSLPGAVVTRHPELCVVDTGPFIKKKALQSHHCGVQGNHFCSLYGGIII